MKLREGFAMFVLIALALIWLTGCASEQAYRDYTIAYTGYMNSQKAKQAESPKLVEIVAKDGETITMQGVKSFTVYAPAGSAYAGPVIQPPQQIKNSEWVGTVNNVVSGGMALGSTAVLGSVIKSVVNSAGENAGHNTTTTVNTTGSYNTENTSSVSVSDSGNTTNTNTNSGNTISDSGNTTETTETTTTSTTTNTNDDHSNNNSNNDNSVVN